MRWNWLPWRFLIRRAARAHGFLDPLALIARLQRFAQPSEVSEPIELLRAGVVFHARGLINTRVIQHNLDWVWPWWIERQFDPHSDAFVPRAFSVTHVNLTHRNWTAVGLPDHTGLPIVDPRGLVTPFHDGWSLDAWVIGDDGDRLHPSREANASQYLDLSDGIAVVTEVVRNGLRLLMRASVSRDREGAAELVLDYEARAEPGGHLVLALRPYNPEGVSFVHRVALHADRRAWHVDDAAEVYFDAAADAHYASDYAMGDVAIHLNDPKGLDADECDVGLATAAALFRTDSGASRRLRVRVPLRREADLPVRAGWDEALAGTARLDVPDARLRFLYDAAVRTLVLHSVDDVYPGPYTYKRFWFRDAAFIIHALLCAGLPERARAMLAHFPERQHRSTGYFHSQDGEWDSNGEAMWIMGRYRSLTGEDLPESWLNALRRGGRWIARKRTRDGNGPHAGLLPAGFSAEHFGPNDYYYWDDYWAVAGLQAAAEVLDGQGDEATATRFRTEAEALSRVMRGCHDSDARRLGMQAMPASPYRRMDSGAVGSLVAGYPLQLLPPGDARLLGTADWLMDNARVHGGFFQDMIHSGVNAYLTLHLAQVLMRAGDPRCHDLVRAVADLATSTGQWPEAIHPRTLGGCMGDGQHVWAAAEWVAMLRNAFVREEGDRLVLAGGVPPQWLAAGERMHFGPALTRFGTVTVDIEPAAGDKGGVVVRWTADWRERPVAVDVAPAGAQSVTSAPETGGVTLQWRAQA